MYLTYSCPRCQRPNRSVDFTGPCELTCTQCGWSRTVDPALESADSAPSACVRCGNPDLWRQKSFPQWLGLTFVALGAVGSSIAWGYHRPVLALGILMCLALLDMVLYATMPDVLVCYRCRTKHHRTDVSGHGAFNHELAERYRQERIRLQQTGGAQTTDDAAPLSKVN